MNNYQLLKVFCIMGQSNKCDLQLLLGNTEINMRPPEYQMPHITNFMEDSPSWEVNSLLS